MISILLIWSYEIISDSFFGYFCMAQSIPVSHKICSGAKLILNYPRQLSFYVVAMVILSLPLIQEGQLSVSGERMCTSSD